MKDPVCGMQVTEDSKFTSQFDSKKYFFCSQSCNDKFDNSPTEFVEKECCGHCESTDETEKKHASDTTVSEHECHQHQHKASHPGHTVTANHDVTSKDAVFTCPMHLEIEQVGLVLSVAWR